ncbi:Holliday junction resolvase RuvX [Parenemella sanctibonifatiensis]|uniref:Putative pre-16S rRNA nuclease n=1 Tax=Parenemella sanctibonifatiensis TaxID=2016505 RepID=A0A255E4L4_9ACTN|nr:Holliday junction resolvase RuvX [Parenemella sanctibonifatiensis]OYN86527.1 Holliday junction resolvase RuvX [Parenemella sanctibonifatiensis]
MADHNDDQQPPGPQLRPGVRLALDWGQARIGVAACDARATLAFPVETVDARQRPTARIKELISEYEPIEVMLGLPRNLAGAEALAASQMRERAAGIAKAIGVPLRLVDERMTTATAHRQLADAGKSSRQRRKIVDQAAAVAILEFALAAEAATGEPPGEVVEQKEPGAS